MTYELFRKELTLQRDPIRFGYILVSLCLLDVLMAYDAHGMWIPRVKNGDAAQFLFNAIIIILSVLLVPLLCGVTAVTEERTTGAIERQLSEPVSRARQWLVKVGVVYLLTVLFGMLLPMSVQALISYLDVGLPPIFLFQKSFWPGVYALLFASAAIYAGTLTRVPLIGLFLSIAVLAVLLTSLSQYFASARYTLLLFHVNVHNRLTHAATHYSLVLATAAMVTFLAYWNFRLRAVVFRRLMLHVLVWVVFVNVLVIVVYRLETGALPAFRRFW